jgi:hypothetical protein
MCDVQERHLGVKRENFWWTNSVNHIYFLEAVYKGGKRVKKVILKFLCLHCRIKKILIFIKIQKKFKLNFKISLGIFNCELSESELISMYMN